MDRTVTLVLFALLTAFVSDVAASCRKVENEDMVEYVCEDGHPIDLTTVPETIEKLRIFRMPLYRITADTFSKFGGNLWVLSCSHCEIMDIDADALPGMKSHSECYSPIVGHGYLVIFLEPGPVRQFTYFV